jgi:hypothetical protein
VVAFLNLKNFKIFVIIIIESEKGNKIMSRYVNPKNFHELVVEMDAMEFGDWVENEDNNRYVELGNMIGAKYELYEDHEFIGGTSDVVAAAQFIAEGWNY